MKHDLEIIKPGKITVELGVEGSLEIDRKYMSIYVNKAGVKMLRYKYCKVVTKEDDYYVTDFLECKRIVQALNSPEVRFVKIGNDFVSINKIDYIKEKTGYKEIKEEINDN